MPFDPTIPAPGSEIRSAELRNQFNSLKALIDVVTPPGPGAEADPVFAASEAAQLIPGDKAKLDSALQPGSPISQLANDAGYSSFNPNSAGELYNCFGIFDGGNATNGVRVGGNQVDLQLHNAGQTVVVLSAGQKQLIGYSDYANPVPSVAAGWADGVLRDGAGNAFVSSPLPGLTQDVVIAGVTLHFTNGLLTGVN